MDVSKKELARRFEEGDIDYVMKQAKIISDYLLARNFKISSPELRDDMSQECLLNLWKKIQSGKMKPNANIFAFIWRNSQFRILEIIRKEKRRNEIAQFSSYDEVMDDVAVSDYIDFDSDMGGRYASVVVQELSTAA